MPIYECPICRTKVSVPVSDDLPWRPFCSQRCKLVDLGRWLGEEYRISEEIPPEGLPDDVHLPEPDDDRP